MGKTAQNNQQLPDLVKRLKGLTTHPPPERLREEILRLIEDIVEHAAKDESVLAETALLLMSRAQSANDPELESFYTSCLPGMGSLAPPLAIMACLRGQGDDPKTQPGLSIIPNELMLHAVNRILSGRIASLEPLHQAALDALPKIAKTPPEPASQFLEDCAKQGLSVAYPVREALMDGPYGKAWSDALNAATTSISARQRPDKNLAPMLSRHGIIAGPDCIAPVTELLTTQHAPTLRAALKLLTQADAEPSSTPAKAAAKLLLHPDKLVQRGALDVIATLAPRDQGKLFAALYKKNENIRPDILSRLPMLPNREYKLFIKTLGNAGKKLGGLLFATLAALEPDAALSHLEAAMTGSNGAESTPLLELLPTFSPPVWANADKAVANFKPAKTAKKAPAKKKDKEGGFFSMFGGGGGGEAISVQFGDSTVSDSGSASEYSGRKVTPIYESRTLQRIDFSNAFLENAAFQQCTFVGVKFTNTLIVGTRFIECVFVDCDFSGARLFDCTMLDIRIERSVLRTMTLCASRITMFDVSESDLRGLKCHDLRLRTCRFTACDLTELQLLDSNCEGLEFLLSQCTQAKFCGSRLLRTALASSGLPSPSFGGLFTDNPTLMQAEDRFLTRRSATLAGKISPPAQNGDLADKAVDLWFETRELRAQSLAFMINNERRISWCCDKLGPEKAGFFSLAPFLLHSETFERHSKELEPLPLDTRVAGYAVDYTTLDFARKFFPKASPPMPVPDPILIEALYTIGSVGTVAQNAGSDLDYWVCYDPENMPENLIDGLMDKLEHIERWADETFGLEVHFFTMDLENIRQNNFGFSDSESSGSAQALLLKEEFYRSAVCAAGKAPLWWVTPVGSSDKEYARIRTALATGRAADRYVDLGNLVDIPPEEFFGASLWQIVKALKSPFKSIMKFGLLEKYIASEDNEGSTLLCDRLKDNLARGFTSLSKVDPYVLMFHEISEHYVRTKEKDSLKLVRLSFFLKTKIAEFCSDGLRAQRREETEIHNLFNSSATRKGDASMVMDWTFDKLVSIGTLVNKFIVRTYMRVRDSQANIKIAITPEDLTKLGRKIFATFSKRQHKIEHIPFLSITGNTFRVLHVSASGKKMGQPSYWEIQGAQEVSGKDRLQLANLRKGPDLAESLVWLTANGLYEPGMGVKGDYSISPVTAKDIESLQDKLLEFFPPKTTFNTDISEMLNTERIVRAFFILNLIQPREHKALVEASIVYSTNWGELFCVTVPVKDKTLLNNPAEFLLQNVEQEFTDLPVMDYFIPDRCNCPHPSI
ncbi:class I adenylate cyclase [Desulfovibrio ferrophilus]|uniref:Adenylate cyclase n=1 Tax=Desulfovibrio ferrophilus TaxID=241368 RepID=A0A2Z6AV21_9BACT|nr:class I adenylate cyclase [Desulfovibrio ferrophilus]BBD07089.1 adenylate cyclase [Desulfovibrio ferrophilus]